MTSSLVGQDHVPVLLEEVLENLLTTSSGIYCDATFGRGGHSRAILDRLSPEGRLIALDQDPQAIAVGAEYARREPRLSIHQARFSGLGQVLAEQGVAQLQGVLMDIGVSSPQLDDPQRGFSFTDGPLDMRMNPQEGDSAATWINDADEDEIVKVLRTHGEERNAKRIARAIVAARPLSRTSELAELVADAVPAAVRRRASKHPATQTFQAIRIHINAELEDLRRVLDESIDLLAPGGRLVVISFHSLEDRMVKQFMRREAKGDPLPAHVPIQEKDIKRRLRLCGKAVKADKEEVDRNPRARSAVMRIAEKLG